jgi:acetylornithine deacetylase/succinyl-diaminopimelate desuccinylase-like protein
MDRPSLKSPTLVVGGVCGGGQAGPAPIGNIAGRPEVVGVGKTSRHVTGSPGAAGGGKVNTIPGRFFFTIDRRINPEERLAEVKREIVAAIRKAERRNRRLKVRVRTLLYVPPGWTDLRAGICRTAQAACRAVTGHNPRFRMTAGFTDMHWLTRDIKVPAIMYGTSGAGAHSDLEYTRVPSILTTARIYAEIIMRMPAP